MAEPGLSPKTAESGSKMDTQVSLLEFGTCIIGLRRWLRQ